MSDLIHELIQRRGYTADTAEYYLHPDTYPFPQEEPEEVTRIVSILSEVIHNNEHITVWGDFDADGQTATAVLIETLRRLTPNVSYYIPSRFDNNHGLNFDQIVQISKNWPKSMIITCDCGTNDLEEINAANSLGLKVIITDHHEATYAPNLLHPYLFNPTLSESPYRGLCGVGVAYVISRSLLKLFGLAQYINPLLDLVAIGTIADVAPHTPLNRALIYRGLPRLYAGVRPGIKAMLEINEMKNYMYDSEGVSFKIGPMLNAAGRLASANIGVELLTTRETDKAQIYAHRLKVLNQERQIQMSLLETELETFLPENVKDSPALIIQGKDWPIGLIGLTAGKLANKYKKPAIIMTGFRDGLVRASCRSTEGIHILQLLETQEAVLEQYGGHAGAAGFTIKEKNIPQFMAGFLEEISKIQSSGDANKLVYDCVVDWSQLDLSLKNPDSTISAVEATAPHTRDNPIPIFMSPEVFISEFKRIGESQTHAQVKFVDLNGVVHEVFWWSFDKDWEFKYSGVKLDIAYTVARSFFAGRDSVRIILEDVRCHVEELVDAVYSKEKNT